MNYLFDVTVFGAVGNGVADDTASIDAAVVAADTASRGTVFFPLGTWMTDGICLAGVGINIVGLGPGTILKANCDISGAVLDFNGFQAATNNVGTSIVRDFNIEGDGVSDAGKTHYGMDTTDASGVAFNNIGIRNTGGPGWYSESQWGSTFSSIVVERPVDADANDVPYVYFRGWMNGNKFDSCGFRSVTTDPDGSSVWLIEDDGTVVTHDMSVNACWFEFQHTPEGGAVLDFVVRTSNIEVPHFFDGGVTSDDQGTCFMRFREPVNGAGGTVGGNYIWGQLPGDGKSASSYSVGIDLIQSRNFVNGVRGYDGRNVRLAPGVGYSSIVIGGRQSGVMSSIPSIVDESGESTNRWLDLAVGEMAGVVVV